ncbi:hypothetical protein HYH02_000557 [Chlamydomonas schloesseri]|uniref:Uncharacterized protein n=1 Tax=Chlamydomonas schloesseri TaxID=2026947 RepID=A0A835WVW2_9CHLO|nr:hypothetical protein HYH02_000557 [Chlamydomonas schloesseri]|eukprot:KAG2454720.1 hypothetical protein HYH02_000557 [Chlamydomonas schloesseri]
MLSARPNLTVLKTSRCCSAQQPTRRVVMLVRASPSSESSSAAAPKDAEKQQAPSSSQTNQKAQEKYHGDNKRTDNHKGTWSPPFESLKVHEPLPVEDRKTNIDF